MQNKYTMSAMGQECTVQLAGVCNGDPATTVLAHMRKWYTRAGMGLKAHDIHGAYCCSSCHDVLDARVKSDFEREWLELQHLMGVIETQQIMIKQGVLKL